MHQQNSYPIINVVIIIDCSKLPNYNHITHFPGSFPVGSAVKNLFANAGDVDLIPESGRSPGEGNGNPLQYSCLEHSTERGAWWATVHRVIKESDTTERLNKNNQLVICGTR